MSPGASTAEDTAANEAGATKRRPGRLRRFGDWLGDIWYEHRVAVAATLILVAFLGVYFWRNIFVPIEPGEAGVRWNRFTGTVLDQVYLEGTVVIPPWDKMYIYDVRVQERTDSIVVLSVNGLSIQVRISTRYQPVLLQLPQLHQRYGPEYATKVVLPEVVGAMRRVIGGYTPDQVYAKDEFALLDEINDLVRGEVDARFITIEEVLIRSLALPPELQAAILDKLTQEQASLAYEFRLARERSEAERRGVEGQGIADFERISGIPILQWRGLEVTEKLANSPNSKIIVIPTGSDQLPIILNPGGD